MRIPPHSDELETQILGDLMAIGNPKDLKAQKAMLQLTPKSFYKPLNAELFALIRLAFQKSEPFGFVDISANIGDGKDSLYGHQIDISSQHSGRPPIIETFEYHIQRLLGLESARRNMGLMQSALEDSESLTDPADINAVLRETAKEVCNAGTGIMSAGIFEWEVIDEIDSGKSDEQSLMPTSSVQLNALLGGGLMSGSLVTVAGTAGIGKTGFAIWLMDSVATQQTGKQAIFFSLEMRPSEIVKRHLGIKGGNLYSRQSYEEREISKDKALQYPLKLYDYRNPDLDFILTRARLDAAERPISVIVIDYLTLVTIRGSYERNDLRQTAITSGLAFLAAELDCIVIALSQVNRGAATGDDHCPQPHHAADSSGSHRSSHVWLGIDRPETYKDDPIYRDQFVIKCRKNRTGSDFEYIMSFNSGTFLEVPYAHFLKPEKTSIEQKLFRSSYKPHRS